MYRCTYNGQAAGYLVGTGGLGAVGAVRIVYPGNVKKFPTTCVS
jgi:hypothetical protein